MEWTVKRVTLRLLGAIALLLVPLIAQNMTLTPALYLYIHFPGTYGVAPVLAYGAIDVAYLYCAAVWWLRGSTAPRAAKWFVVATQIVAFLYEALGIAFALGGM